VPRTKANTTEDTKYTNHTKFILAFQTSQHIGEINFHYERVRNSTHLLPIETDENQF
jgi:hypothetical protein